MFFDKKENITFVFFKWSTQQTLQKKTMCYLYTKIFVFAKYEGTNIDGNSFIITK